MKKLFLFAIAILGSIILNAQQLPDVKVQDKKGKVVSVRNWVDNHTPFVV